jgi:hypothetical protein
MIFKTIFLQWALQNDQDKLFQCSLWNLHSISHSNHLNNPPPTFQICRAQNKYSPKLGRFLLSSTSIRKWLVIFLLVTVPYAFLGLLLKKSILPTQVPCIKMPREFWAKNIYKLNKSATKRPIQLKWTYFVLWYNLFKGWHSYSMQCLCRVLLQRWWKFSLLTS